MFSKKAKQVMSSFDLVAIVRELNDAVIGSRVENIYQVGHLTLLFSLHPRLQLIIEAGRKIHLTSYEIEKPRFPSLFCRILRKFLKGGLIQKVQMDGFERIVTAEIAYKNKSYKLVCEIFGKGNIILTDNEDRILHALSYRMMRDRKIVRGELLEPPPSRGYDLFKVTRQEFEGLQAQEGNAARAITELLAFGGLYAEELLLRANISKGRTAASLTEEEVDKVYEEVTNLISNFTQKYPHVVVDKEGHFVDVLPFPLKMYLDYAMERYPTYNEAADDFFTKLTHTRKETDTSKERSQGVEERRRILIQQEARLESLDHDADVNRRIGDAIYLHILAFQDLFHQIGEARAKGIGWNKLVSEMNEKKARGEAYTTLVDSIDPVKRVMAIEIDDLCFELQLHKSIFENASDFYEKAKESRSKLQRLKKVIIETKSKVITLQKNQWSLEQEAASPVKVREKFWFEKFHWAKSSEDFLIVGGRDASTNEILIKRHLDPDDLVFHADIAGAPFVILKTLGKTSSEQTIFEAAQLAASYSRGWREGWTSLDVYWIRPGQVSKQAPSGEYLSRGMFVIRGSKNYIRDVSLRLSIGIVEEEGNLSIIGGPTASIDAHARYKVDITPGRQSSGKIAQTIRTSLASKATKELGKKISKLKIELIQRFIPAGKSEIAIR